MLLNDVWNLSYCLNRTLISTKILPSLLDSDTSSLSSPCRAGGRGQGSVYPGAHPLNGPVIVPFKTGTVQYLSS